jgi:predicted nucleic acid-binding protein
MARVYLETSFFSACVTTRPDVNSQSWKQRSLSWLKTQAPRHALSVSAEVVRELSSKSYPNRDAARAFVADIQLLPVTAEVLALGQLLIDQRVMPGPLKGDAIHVAVAAYHGIEYVLSWNVQHLANPNKRVHLARVLMGVGKAAPLIVTPDVLWEEESHD